MLASAGIYIKVLAVLKEVLWGMGISTFNPTLSCQLLTAYITCVQEERGLPQSITSIRVFPTLLTPSVVFSDLGLTNHFSRSPGGVGYPLPTAVSRLHFLPSAHLFTWAASGHFDRLHQDARSLTAVPLHGTTKPLLRPWGAVRTGVRGRGESTRVLDTASDSTPLRKPIGQY